MAAFCWMLIEGIYFYFFVVKVYNINTKMYMYHVMSWGLPLIIVAISLGIAAGKEGLQSYTSDKYLGIKTCVEHETPTAICILDRSDGMVEKQSKIGYLIESASPVIAPPLSV
ncbi:hypothetical protein pdam_00016402 [Pocillopora damicornis]|uniref:G-protein coupled receptors family 2 profile 2 domain-containing protein n=1 Tax=Pocillopora damicornis TaxID=46731 RepID=A0A3M6UQZ7_POCDA|nr:hypothetical protein pdam_00016402 [Pocillopora damicornis]